MAFERFRAHSAVLGAVAVLAAGAVSVASLVVAEGRLEQFDQDRDRDSSTMTATVAAATSASAPPSTASPTTTTTVVSRPPTGLPTHLFASLNLTRTAQGLAPLTWSDRLSTTAQRVSDAAAASGTAVPADLDAILGLGYARAAENELAGPSTSTATSVVAGWMGSAAGRAPILDAGLREIGIGTASGPDQSLWITVHFGG
jgi:uncharacterized protein YkwD